MKQVVMLGYSSTLKMETTSSYETPTHFKKLYGSAVQRSYVLGHNSLMPMEVRAPPHYYYYYYYYYYHHHLICTTTTTTTNNNNNNNNSNNNKIIRKKIKNGVSMGEKNRYKFLRNI
jgi:hypothetical protein